MAEASSTSTLRTLMPSGGVWGVLSIMPRIWPAACSAAARVHLRLDDDLAAQPLGDRACLRGRVGDVALRHRHPELAQQRLGLVLVDLHAVTRAASSWSGTCAAATRRDRRTRRPSAP